MKYSQEKTLLFIDIQILSSGLGGGLTFVKHLIPDLIRDLADDFSVCLIGEKNLIVKIFGNLEDVKIIDSGSGRSIHSRVIKSISIYREIGKYENAILWGPLNTLGYLGNPKMKKVVTIHDTMVLDHPGFYNVFQRKFRKYQLDRAIMLADYIITVSNFTKKCISKHYPSIAASKKIKVIHEGVKMPSYIMPRATVESTKKFCLFVGVGRRNKNLNFLVQIHNMLLSEYGYEGSLVIVGNVSKEIIKDLKNTSIDKKLIEFPGFVSSKDLERLYYECDAFIFPSIYEGFGLPPLEAAAHGAPVVVSDIEVMREVCSDFASFGNIENPSEFAKVVKGRIDNDHRFSFDNDVLVKKFSWESTINLYKTVLSKI